MEYFEIVFPVNIGPLTYACDKPLSGILEAGMIVSAPLKNRLTKGVVIGKSAGDISNNVKAVQEVHTEIPVLSKGMIRLLGWMSEYYMAEQGLVLKTMLPGEAFTKVRQRKMKISPGPGFFKASDFSVNVSSNDVAVIRKAVSDNAYRTFLAHAPSTLYEYSFLINMLSGIRNAIILLPEVSLVQNLYPVLHERFGERLCLLHSGLSSGMRSGAIERILLGRSDIVLGTRSAVFAPMRKVSMIAVLHEHSSSYKQESTPCYFARDVAVMRGYIEKAVVLLSSISPSIESLYNCKSGKYALLKPACVSKKPRVRIVDVRFEKLSRPYLSKTVIDAAMKYMRNDKKIMFVVNRRGYSTLLQCSDCGHIEECPHCRIPLVFHKQDMSMKCHYCGYALARAPESCSRCRGYNLKLLGAGTQRAQEDIEDIIGMKTLRVDGDTARKRADMEEMVGAAFNNDMRIIIGTKLMTRRVRLSSGFSMAAILSADIFLHIPDFRSAEKAYQEISSVIDKIEYDGEVFIQTRMPQNFLYKYVKKHDYTAFFNEELQKRKSLLYPPFSRLILIKLVSKKSLSKELPDIREKIENDVEILGPYITENARGCSEYRLLLRSPVRGDLHAAARIFLEAFKGTKDVKIRVDVDPLVI